MFVGPVSVTHMEFSLKWTMKYVKILCEIFFSFYILTCIKMATFGYKIFRVSFVKLNAVRVCKRGTEHFILYLLIYNF
jgi:hypothetical protein